MDHFLYRDGNLHGERVSLAEVARLHGTPCYVYSRATLERHWHAFDKALDGHPHRVCFAVKANSNLAVLDTLARLGSGFDIVSGGELERVLIAGGDPGKTVFSGVGKTRQEMGRALEAGIGCFNVESSAELDALNAVAGAANRRAPIALRVNPDVDAKTHPFIATGLRENKFGVPISEALALYQVAAKLPHIDIRGVACHIGSQLTELQPFMDALARLLVLMDELQRRGISLEHVDVGGGLGIRYRDETPPEPAEYAQAIREVLGSRRIKVMLEPGRAIAGNAGVLLTRVLYLKHSDDRNFAVVDAAMNDLLRPALYGAWQSILPVRAHEGGELLEYDVVGPVCETGDFLGKSRPLAVAAGDLLAVRSAGAYGFVMSSNYNTRPRAPEVMVDGEHLHLARERESVAELLRPEHLLPDPSA